MLWSTFHIMEFSKRHHKERIYSIYAFQGDRGVHPGARRGERRKRSNRHFWPTDRPTDHGRQRRPAFAAASRRKARVCPSSSVVAGRRTKTTIGTEEGRRRRRRQQVRRSLSCPVRCNRFSEMNIAVVAGERAAQVEKAAPQQLQPQHQCWGGRRRRRICR